VEFDRWVAEIDAQAGALRAAAVSAGPRAAVPTCPEWTVLDLVSHVAGVHDWAARALHTDPAEPDVRADPGPAEWADLLSWWTARTGALVAGLTAAGPHAPAWVFDDEDAPTAAFWARRQAHETAVHRLDAEHARSGSPVPVFLYDTDFAADGIDEALTMWVPRRVGAEPPDLRGEVAVHAVDAGRSWLVRLAPGAPPAVEAVDPGADLAADATLAGTADAVYRAVWHRPSIATVHGDASLIAALRTP
jgi:uncharacterized protein (TIGR03083 family)